MVVFVFSSKSKCLTKDVKDGGEIKRWDPSQPHLLLLTPIRALVLLPLCFLEVRWHSRGTGTPTVCQAVCQVLRVYDLNLSVRLLQFETHCTETERLAQPHTASVAEGGRVQLEFRPIG